MEIGDIGTRILLARRKRGLRQGEVAKLAGISAKQMSQIETNKPPGVQVVAVRETCQPGSSSVSSRPMNTHLRFFQAAVLVRRPI